MREKFNLGHKCPKHIQLHVMEELLVALQIPEESPTSNPHQDNDTSLEEEDEETTGNGGVVVKLSLQAATGTTSKKSFRMTGLIGKTEILILVDSGSNSCFINEDLVQALQLPTQQIPAAKVTVAGGGSLLCE